MTAPTPNAPRVLDAPWRERYLRAMAAAEAGADHRPGPAAPRASPTGCFLRDYWLAPDQDAANLLVLRRTDDHARRLGMGEHAGGMILLNLYPYAAGHLLVALGDGRPRLADYEVHQRAALWKLVDDAAAALERALEPQGLNIGVNQGRAAGAGVPQHLHVHLVPRWSGDVNFMTVVGATRVIPASPHDTARRLRDAARALSIPGDIPQDPTA